MSERVPSVFDMAISTRPGRTNPTQPTLQIGRPLVEVTFCVVDLETTGGGEGDAITEIGAVKVRGGEVIGEFQTLVNPAATIPPLIAVLTGITNQMVAGAPRLTEVLPSFLAFSTGTVLVAHNAGFDVGFLKRACAAQGYPWPGNAVIDTVGLARSALLRDEVPNCKLATLATHFHAKTTPVHRALADARATVDVLHGLLERIGNLGVHTLEDLHEFTHRVSPQRRAKRGWATGLPEAPGVYWFYADLPDAASGTVREVLYVGKSRNLNRRVRTYFTAAEKRPRMEEMIRVATGVDTTVCRTPLEAEILELRLIAAHAPRYNRRSKFPERQHWIKVTAEPFPRLSVVRKPSPDQALYFGPFARRAAIEDTLAALYDAFPIRRCTTRLSTRTPSSTCALADLGRCCAPCDHRIAPGEYNAVVDDLRFSLAGDVRAVVAAAGQRLSRLVSQERFEEAADVRGRLETFARASLRHHRVKSLIACSQIVAAYWTQAGWEIHVIRHGRLAEAALARPGQVAQAVARDAVAVAATVPEPLPGLPAATVEETERIADWMERPGVRLIEIEGDWSWPLHLHPAMDFVPSPELRSTA